MEESVKNSARSLSLSLSYACDFLQNIDDEFFNEKPIDPLSAINDAGASEYSESLTA